MREIILCNYSYNFMRIYCLSSDINGISMYLQKILIYEIELKNLPKTYFLLYIMKQNGVLYELGKNVSLRR